jgi:hypothetical protein
MDQYTRKKIQPIITHSKYNEVMLVNIPLIIDTDTNYINATLFCQELNQNYEEWFAKNVIAIMDIINQHPENTLLYEIDQPEQLAGTFVHPRIMSRLIFQLTPGLLLDFTDIIMEIKAIYSNNSTYIASIYGTNSDNPDEDYMYYYIKQDSSTVEELIKSYPDTKLIISFTVPTTISLWKVFIKLHGKKIKHTTFAFDTKKKYNIIKVIEDMKNIVGGI